MVPVAVGCVLVLVGCSGGPAVGAGSSGSSTGGISSGTASPSELTSSPGSSVAGASSQGAYVPATREHKAQNAPIPEKPARMNEFSEYGLEQFVRYWFAQLNYAHRTGDVAELSKLGSPDCSTCRDYVNRALEFNAEGRWVVGANYSVQAAKSELASTPGQISAILVQYGVEGGSVRKADGTFTVYEGSAVSALTFNCTYSASGWSVQAIGR